MKKYLFWPFLIIGLNGIAQNIFPSSGSVGIGTESPNPLALLHLKSPNHSYLFLEKASSSYESGIAFIRAGRPDFYLWSDDYDNNALKIEASGLSGEDDFHPRLMMPLDSKNILLALSGGSIGIGTKSPSEKLSVNGNVRAKKLIVTQTGWSDYVFDSSYQLKPLTEVERFVKTNKRLPEMPSAKQIENDGVDVGENQALLLKKIEELTLYVIELNKKVAMLESQNKKQNNE